MTPAEDLAVVRARLERMVTLAEEVRATNLLPWITAAEHVEDGGGTRDGAFIAAASPDLLLRVAREALGVLNQHQEMCQRCGAHSPWSCPVVAAVLRAWQP